jgi:hypothetical protein
MYQRDWAQGTLGPSKLPIAQSPTYRLWLANTGVYFDVAPQRRTAGDVAFEETSWKSAGLTAPKPV